MASNAVLLASFHVCVGVAFNPKCLSICRAQISRTVDATFGTLSELIAALANFFDHVLTHLRASAVSRAELALRAAQTGSSDREQAGGDIRTRMASICRMGHHKQPQDDLPFNGIGEASI